MLVAKLKVFIILLKKNNKNVIKTLAKKTMGSHYPLKQSMNVNKYLKIIKN